MRHPSITSNNNYVNFNADNDETSGPLCGQSSSLSNCILGILRLLLLLLICLLVILSYLTRPFSILIFILSAICLNTYLFIRHNKWQHMHCHGIFLSVNPAFNYIYFIQMLHSTLNVNKNFLLTYWLNARTTKKSHPLQAWWKFMHLKVMRSLTAFEFVHSFIHSINYSFIHTHYFAFCF